MSRSYLDALSGQPLHPQARASFEGFADRAWADPSQVHHEGRTSAQILEAARATVAAILGISASGVSFHPTSVLTELAISGAIAASRARVEGRPVAITSPVERSATLAALASVLGEENVLQVPVKPTGAVYPLGVAEAIAEHAGSAAIIVLQVGNTEVGTLQPLAEVAAIATTHSIPVVSDATGALGLVQIPPGWAVLFADASTWAGPPGVGVLAIADPSAWKAPPAAALLHGTSPADTVDVLSAAATAAALDAVARAQPALSGELFELTNRVRAQLADVVDDIDVLGDPTDRLPQVVTFSLLYADGERLASELDRRGVAIGSGSACASRAGLPSHVLAAIGALTHGNVRLSLPVNATADDIEHVLRELPAAADVVRRDADGRSRSASDV